MSAQSVESILTKAMSDAQFADELFADPEKALAGYDLTAEEKAKFQGLTRAQFEGMSPEDRKSFVMAWERAGGGNNHNENLLTGK